MANSARKGPALAERSERFGARQPTSPERRAGQAWDASYRDGPSPCDIGRPQQAIVRVVAGGGFTGSVLGAGYGTGENALHVASRGLPAVKDRCPS